MSDATTSEPRTLTATGVLVTDDGTFALLDDGTRVRLPSSIASGIAAGMVAGGQGVSVQGTHSATAPLDASTTESAPVRARATDMELKRDPNTGRFSLAKTDGEVLRATTGRLTYAEQMTRKEITRCLRQRGHSKRSALSVAVQYIQHERFVTWAAGLRGEDAGRMAVDGAWHAARCSEIWRMCGHDTLKQRDPAVTDSPLDQLAEPEPSAA